MCAHAHEDSSGVFSCGPVVRGVTQSDLRIVTGFGPFNLPTCNQLQRGRDHSHIGAWHLWMLYSCVSHVTRAYTGLWCFKAYESLETRYRVIFTLVVGDVGGVFGGGGVVDTHRHQIDYSAYVSVYLFE